MTFTFEGKISQTSEHDGFGQNQSLTCAPGDEPGDALPQHVAQVHDAVAIRSGSSL